VRPVPNVLSLFGVAKSVSPHSAVEKDAPRTLMGRGDDELAKEDVAPRRECVAAILRDDGPV
jgi:hypothetical protein